jgi:hypothetical protein
MASIFCDCRSCASSRFLSVTSGIDADDVHRCRIRRAQDAAPPLDRAHHRPAPVRNVTARSCPSPIPRVPAPRGPRSDRRHAPSRRTPVRYVESAGRLPCPPIAVHVTRRVRTSRSRDTHARRLECEAQPLVARAQLGGAAPDLRDVAGSRGQIFRSFSRAWQPVVLARQRKQL